MHKHSLSIWFFIGLILSLYGFIIAAEGLYELLVPPAEPLVMAQVHSALWWGLIMLVLGLFYVIKFRPKPGDDASSSTRVIPSQREP